MISAKVVADSIDPRGNRLTSLLVTMPRFILAEFNTHRMLSKNSASSRAIPFKKMVESVQNNPFIPIAWQKDHKGMQGTEYIESEPELTLCKKDWLEASRKAINSAKMLNKRGGTKQICNRLLEPFMYHTVLVSGTEFSNFFDLRCPQYKLADRFGGGYFKSKKDFSKAYLKVVPGDKNHLLNANLIAWLKINEGQSEIHMMAVAETIWDAINESTPKQLKAGEWHIPFGDNIQFEEVYPFDGETNLINNQNRIKIATARCARLSYQTLGKEPKIDYKADLKLHDILLSSGHFSPFEHCARVMTEKEYHSYIRGNINTGKGAVYNENNTPNKFYIDFDNKITGWCNNYRGFIQYRKLIENDNKQ